MQENQGTYFVGRAELVGWINSVLALNYTKIEQVGPAPAHPARRARGAARWCTRADSQRAPCRRTMERRHVRSWTRSIRAASPSAKCAPQRRAPRRPAASRSSSARGPHPARCRSRPRPTLLSRCVPRARRPRALARSLTRGATVEQVNFNAATEYEMINNYKILQAGFNKLNIQKVSELRYACSGGAGPRPDICPFATSAAAVRRPPPSGSERYGSPARLLCERLTQARREQCAPVEPGE